MVTTNPVVASTLNSHQQIAYDYAMNMGRGESVILNALPGTGKTFLMAKIMNDLHAKKNYRGMFVAFMNGVVETAKAKISPVHEITTLNSYGMKIIRNYWAINGIRKADGFYSIDDKKEQKLISEFYWNRLDAGEQLKYKKHDTGFVEWSKMAMLSQAVNICKGRLVDPEDPASIYVVMKIFGQVDATTDEVECVQYVMRESIRWIEEYGSASLNDQVWAPVVLRMPNIETFDIIAVDEVQDFNSAKIVLTIQIGGGKSSFIMAGDPLQSIMQFSGSELYSFESIRDRMKAKEFKLVTSYRFGPNVAERVRVFAPEIIGEGNTEIFEVGSIPLAELDEETAILCRYNKQLIHIGKQLLDLKFPFRMKPENALEKKMTNVVYALSSFVQKVYKMNAWTVDAGMMFSDATFEDWQKFELAILEKMKLPPEIWYSKLEYYALVKEVIAGKKQTGLKVNDIKLAIAELFSGTEGPQIKTSHAAKGQEFKTVVIPQPESYEAREGATYVDEIASDNIQFVAMTRPVSKLIISTTMEVM